MRVSFLSSVRYYSSDLAVFFFAFFAVAFFLVGLDPPVFIVFRYAFIPSRVLAPSY